MNYQERRNAILRANGAATAELIAEGFLYGPFFADVIGVFSHRVPSLPGAVAAGTLLALQAIFHMRAINNRYRADRLAHNEFFVEEYRNGFYSVVHKGMRRIIR